VASNDGYAVFGNSRLEVATIGAGVLGNDTDPDDGPVPLHVTGTSGLSAGASLSMDPDGTFSYLPPPGFIGTDSFNYAVSDGAQAVPGTVQVDVRTPLVWYVDNRAGAGGTGRVDAPFDSLAPLQGPGDPDGPNDIVFVFAGNGPYAGGIVLEDAQKLIGEGAGLTIGIQLLVPPGSRPQIGNAGGAGITLAAGNTVRGLDVNARAGIVGLNIGALTIDQAAVTAAGGPAVSLAGGPIAVILDSVSATGGTNGIVLANTPGLFSVTGNGSAGSGGTISGMSGSGVDLTGVSDVSLEFMEITQNLGSGISGDGVSGFFLGDSSVTDNGDTSGGSEAGLRFDHPTGTFLIVNTVVSGSYEDNVRVTPSNGTLDLTISGSTIRNNLSGTGGSGIRLVGSGTANVTLNLQNGSLVSGHQMSGVLASLTDSARLFAIVVNSTFQSNHIGLDLAADAASEMRFDVSTATFADQVWNAVQVTSSTGCSACTVSGTIAGSQIGSLMTAGSGSLDNQGIGVDIAGTTDAAVAITDNTISHTDKEGISVQAQLGAATLGLTLTGNVVNPPDDDEFPGFPMNPFGILVQSHDASSLCMNMKMNSSSGAGTGTGYRVRQEDFSAFALERFTGDGMEPNDVDAFVTAQNTSGMATMTTLFTGFTGVADGACRAP
jgi:hypothetical protein